MGFAPVLDECVSCHDPIAAEGIASFSHSSGGVVCRRCAPVSGTTRHLPPEARASLRAWTTGTAASLEDEPARRAHQRLLREFLSEHVADGRALRAYDVWERNALGTPAVAR